MTAALFVTEEPQYMSLRSLKFINLPENLKCVQCHKLTLEPVQTPCGHLVCAECITEVGGLGRCPSDDHDEGDCIDIKLDTVRYIIRLPAVVFNTRRTVILFAYSIISKARWTHLSTSHHIKPEPLGEGLMW